MEAVTRAQGTPVTPAEQVSATRRRAPRPRWEMNGSGSEGGTHPKPSAEHSLRGQGGRPPVPKPGGWMSPHGPRRHKRTD